MVWIPNNKDDLFFINMMIARTTGVKSIIASAKKNLLYNNFTVNQALQYATEHTFAFDDEEKEQLVKEISEIKEFFKSRNKRKFNTLSIEDQTYFKMRYC